MQHYNFFVRFSVFHTSVTTCTAVFSSHAFVRYLYNLTQLLMEHLIHSCNTNPQLLCFYNYFAYNNFLNDDHHSDPLWCLFSVIISSPCFQKQTSWGGFKDQSGIFFLSSFLSSQGIKQWNFAKTIWISKLHKSVLWAWSTKFREVLSYWPCCLWKLVQPSFTVLTLSSCCLTHVI